MNRLLSSIRNDIIVQFRSNLYYIGIVVGVLIAFILGFIFTAEQLPTLIPSFMIIVGGGSTMLYIASLILFEKDQGTINAALVSPLKTSEYILSQEAEIPLSPKMFKRIFGKKRMLPLYRL